MEQWIQYIANLGFPIVVSLYLLTRVETKLTALTDSIKELAQALTPYK
ncbi:MAG: YvrJ family protein [Tissierellia bacterium]|nr:YvrJ family protein [Tissierellia bacterium]